HHRVLRKHSRMFYLVEILDRFSRQIAKEILRTQMAMQTAFDAIQSGYQRSLRSLPRYTSAPVARARSTINIQFSYSDSRPGQKVMAKSLHANDHVIVGDCAVVAPVFALFVRRC